MSKCPKCEKNVGTVNITAHDGLHAGTKYSCVSFNCTSCGTVLSMTFDPYKLSELIANDVRKKLSR